MKKNDNKNIYQNNSLPLFMVLQSTALTLALFFLIPSLAHSLDLTLAWIANTEPDLAGYKVYYGTSSGNYSNCLDVGNTTQYTIIDLNQRTTYYFAVTAYNISDNESDYSEEFVYPPTNTTKVMPWIPLLLLHD